MMKTMKKRRIGRSQRHHAGVREDKKNYEKKNGLSNVTYSIHTLRHLNLGASSRKFTLMATDVKDIAVTENYLH